MVAAPRHADLVMAVPKKRQSKMKTRQRKANVRSAPPLGERATSPLQRHARRPLSFTPCCAPRAPRTAVVCQGAAAGAAGAQPRQEPQVRSARGPEIHAQQGRRRRRRRRRGRRGRGVNARAVLSHRLREGWLSPARLPVGATCMPHAVRGRERFGSEPCRPPGRSSCILYDSARAYVGNRGLSGNRHTGDSIQIRPDPTVGAGWRPRSPGGLGRGLGAHATSTSSRSKVPQK